MGEDGAAVGKIWSIENPASARPPTGMAETLQGLQEGYGQFHASQGPLRGRGAAWLDAERPRRKRLLKSQGYNLNVYVSTKIHVLKPQPQSDGIWRWGLWEVI